MTNIKNIIFPFFPPLISVFFYEYFKIHISAACPSANTQKNILFFKNSIIRLLLENGAVGESRNTDRVHRKKQVILVHDFSFGDF